MAIREAIVRKIMAIRDRIKARDVSIGTFEAILTTIREETGQPHDLLLRINPQYRETFYAVRALRGWQTRDRKRIEELQKAIPPIEYLRISITFSIETGTGHEPFFAEVTCDTVRKVTERRAEDETRVINAVIKMFWIMFDVQKALYDLTWLRDENKEQYDAIVKRKEYFQKYTPEIWEEAMDNFLNAIDQLKGFERDPDEYITKEAILKIGVEYFETTEAAEPKYPRVHVFIEKTKERAYTIEKDLLMAAESKFDILKKLRMEVGK